MLHRRVALTCGRTPLHRLERMSERLGIELWIKRDDLSGFGGGGNKGRKLEYLIADALEEGADTVVTQGAWQSNFIRQCAAACRVFGLGFAAAAMEWPYPAPGRETKPAGWKRAERLSGNELLDRWLGADVRLLPDGTFDDLTEHATATAEKLRAEGKKVYQIPGGGSSAVGALGFVRAAEEVLGQVLGEVGVRVPATLLASSDVGPHFPTPAPPHFASQNRGGFSIFDQMASSDAGPHFPTPAPPHFASQNRDGFSIFDRIVVASGSGSTQAGLEYGLRRAGAKTRVIGIATDDEPELLDEMAQISEGLDALLLGKLRLMPGEFDLRLEFCGGGYQVPSQAAADAIRLMAQTEGIFLDPVYTGKAFAGLVALAERGELSGSTLFWHTGGFPGLFIEGYGAGSSVEFGV